MSTDKAAPDAVAIRIAAHKAELKRLALLCFKMGITKRGQLPTAAHLNKLAGAMNAQAAASKGSMAAMDLAVMEKLGGRGALAYATLTNPGAGATERAVALQMLGQIVKDAPSVLDESAQAGYVPAEENIYQTEDDELESLREQWAKR